MSERDADTAADQPDEPADTVTSDDGDGGAGTEAEDAVAAAEPEPDEGESSGEGEPADRQSAGDAVASDAGSEPPDVEPADAEPGAEPVAGSTEPDAAAGAEPDGGHVADAEPDAAAGAEPDGGHVADAEPDTRAELGEPEPADGELAADIELADAEPGAAEPGADAEPESDAEPVGKPADAEPGSDAEPADAEPADAEPEPAGDEPAEQEPADAEPGSDAEPAGDEPAEQEAAGKEPVGAAVASERPPRGQRRGAHARRVTPRERLRELVAPQANRTQALIAVACLIVGFALSVQVQSTSQESSFASLRQSELVGLLDRLNKRQEDLRKEVTRLEQEKAALESEDSEAARRSAQERQHTLAILAGTEPATGPGIELVISDPKGGVNASDLLNAVQELRDAGAEVIQIGTARVTVDTYFLDADNGIIVDHVHLKAPYRIKAIGDPHTMRTAMDIPGGVLESLHRAGAEGTVSSSQSVAVTAIKES